MGLPVVPFISLTYDGTLNQEVGVDPELNRPTAQQAAMHGCPFVACYALNPLGGWMTPDLYRKQFESIHAVMKGSRSQTP